MAPKGLSHTMDTGNEVTETEATTEKPDRSLRPHWSRIIWYGSAHIGALYGLYLVFASASLLTSLWALAMYIIGTIGIGAGSHRLWSHRSYRAKWPLTLLLVFMNTIAFQDSGIRWARDHRVHHKWSETEVDPFDASRGFFFSHIGWLLTHRRPEVVDKVRTIDISDLLSQPILKYQQKYYYYIMPFLAFVMPTAVPMYFWGETFTNAFFVNMMRYILTLNAVFFVNSVSHRYGSKPYDKNINPSENDFVSLITLGEGWHNYHHTFPWDYKTNELGGYTLNITSLFIDIMAKIGWAYDLKTVPKHMVIKRIEKSGDGTHGPTNLWGWGDKDQPAEEFTDALISHKLNPKHSIQ